MYRAVIRGNFVGSFWVTQPFWKQMSGFARYIDIFEFICDTLLY